MTTAARRPLTLRRTWLGVALSFAAGAGALEDPPAALAGLTLRLTPVVSAQLAAIQRAAAVTRREGVIQGGAATLSTSSRIGLEGTTDTTACLLVQDAACPRATLPLVMAIANTAVALGVAEGMMMREIGHWIGPLADDGPAPAAVEGTLPSGAGPMTGIAFAPAAVEGALPSMTLADEATAAAALRTAKCGARGPQRVVEHLLKGTGPMADSGFAPAAEDGVHLSGELADEATAAAALHTGNCGAPDLQSVVESLLNGTDRDRALICVVEVLMRVTLAGEIVATATHRRRIVLTLSDEIAVLVLAIAAAVLRARQSKTAHLLRTKQLRLLRTNALGSLSQAAMSLRLAVAAVPCALRHPPCLQLPSHTRPSSLPAARKTGRYRSSRRMPCVPAWG